MLVYVPKVRIEREEFDALICALGSLWFEDLLPFCRANQPISNLSYAYFSLGNKEPRSKSPIMSQVGAVLGATPSIAVGSVAGVLVVAFLGVFDMHDRIKKLNLYI